MSATYYRVTYPLITQEGHRDFATRDEAEQFARQKRDFAGRFQTTNSWRLVDVEERQDLPEISRASHYS